MVRQEKLCWIIIAKKPCPIVGGWQPLVFSANANTCAVRKGTTMNITTRHLRGEEMLKLQKEDCAQVEAKEWS